MKRARILAILHEHLVPPESIDGMSWAEIRPFKMEYDVTVTLENLGHEVHVLPVGDELQVIRRAIAEWRPHICFNMLVNFHGVRAYDAYVASYFELLKVHYTGCNPRGLFLSGDKALSKKILTYHRIRVPRFASFMRRRTVRKDVKLAFPVIVKTIAEEASLGISQASIVHDVDGLRERVEYMHRKYGTGVIAEEYIKGRELSIGVLGNERLTTLPIIETLFENLPAGSEPIQTERVKWDLKYQKKIGLKAHAATDLPDGAPERIARMAKRVYRALNLSGYARIDLRLAEDGSVYVLEANPNPDLSFGEDFSAGAELAGMSYEDLLQKILALGRRYDPPWLAAEE